MEVELRDENEKQSSEVKEVLEVGLNEKESGLEETLAITNNSLPTFDNSVLQGTENLISEINPTGIPPIPEIEHQLDFPYLSKINFVVPEEMAEFQRHWRNYICKELTEEDELKDNIGTLEITLFQVLGPSKARKMHDYSPNGVVIEGVPTCKIKQPR